MVVFTIYYRYNQNVSMVTYIMTVKLKQLVNSVLITALSSSYAAVIVEPPVVDQDHPTQETLNQFYFDAQTSFHSNLLWRGQSLTNQNPGFASFNQASWSRERITNQIIVNIFSNSGGDNVTAENTTLNSNDNSILSAASTSVHTNYLMAESKIGSQVHFGHKHKKTASLGIYRVVYIWPNGQNWLWANQACTSYEKIKSLTSTELTLNWKKLHILYAFADHLKQPSTEQTLSAVVTANDLSSDFVPYRENWHDYLYIATPVKTLQKYYMYNFEFGYWRKMGRFYSGNLLYQFTKTTTGKLQLFNYDGFNRNESKAGASIALLFNYTTLKKGAYAHETTHA